MTAPRPQPIQLDIRDAIVDAMDGREFHPVKEGVGMVCSIIRDPGWTILESEDPREPDEGTGLWTNLRPSEAKRLVELVDEAEAAIVHEVQDVILDHLSTACETFAAEFPDAPRPERKEKPEAA